MFLLRFYDFHFFDNCRSRRSRSRGRGGRDRSYSRGRGNENSNYEKLFQMTFKYLLHKWL